LHELEGLVDIVDADAARIGSIHAIERFDGAPKAACCHGAGSIAQDRLMIAAVGMQI